MGDTWGLVNAVLLMDRGGGGVGWGSAWEEIVVKPPCNSLSPCEFIKQIIMPHIGNNGVGLKFDTFASPPFTNFVNK